MPPTAHINLSDGTKVTVEGLPDEIAKITRMLTGKSEKLKASLPPAVTRQKKKRATDHIRDLKAEGFFKTGKNLAQVKEALDGKGFIYPVNELSPVLLRLRRRGEIGRLKKDGSWSYTHRE